MAKAVRRRNRLAWGGKGVRAPRARKGSRYIDVLDESIDLVTAELDAQNGDLASVNHALEALDAELSSHPEHDLFEGVCSTTIARAIIRALCAA